MTKKNHYGLSWLRSASVQYEVKNENISQHLTKNTTRKFVLLEREKKILSFAQKIEIIELGELKSYDSKT